MQAQPRAAAAAASGAVRTKRTVAGKRKAAQPPPAEEEEGESTNHAAAGDDESNQRQSATIAEFKQQDGSRSHCSSPDEHKGTTAMETAADELESRTIASRRVKNGSNSSRAMANRAIRVNASASGSLVAGLMESTDSEPRTKAARGAKKGSSAASTTASRKIQVDAGDGRSFVANLMQPNLAEWTHKGEEEEQFKAPPSDEQDIPNAAAPTTCASSSEGTFPATVPSAAANASPAASAASIATVAPSELAVAPVQEDSTANTRATVTPIQGNVVAEPDRAPEGPFGFLTEPAAASSSARVPAPLLATAAVPPSFSPPLASPFLGVPRPRSILEKLQRQQQATLKAAATASAAATGTEEQQAAAASRCQETVQVSHQAARAGEPSTERANLLRTSTSSLLLERTPFAAGSSRPENAPAFEAQLSLAAVPLSAIVVTRRSVPISLPRARQAAVLATVVANPSTQPAEPAASAARATASAAPAAAPATDAAVPSAMIPSTQTNLFDVAPLFAERMAAIAPAFLEESASSSSSDPEAATPAAAGAAAAATSIPTSTADLPPSHASLLELAANHLKIASFNETTAVEEVEHLLAEKPEAAEFCLLSLHTFQQNAEEHRRLAAHYQQMAQQAEAAAAVASSTIAAQSAEPTPATPLAPAVPELPEATAPVAWHSDGKAAVSVERVDSAVPTKQREEAAAATEVDRHPAALSQVITSVGTSVSEVALATSVRAVNGVPTQLDATESPLSSCASSPSLDAPFTPRDAVELTAFSSPPASPLLVLQEEEDEPEFELKSNVGQAPAEPNEEATANVPQEPSAQATSSFADDQLDVAVPMDLDLPASTVPPASAPLIVTAPSSLLQAFAAVAVAELAHSSAKSAAATPAGGFAPESNLEPPDEAQAVTLANPMGRVGEASESKASEGESLPTASGRDDDRPRKSHLSRSPPAAAMTSSGSGRSQKKKSRVRVPSDSQSSSQTVDFHAAATASSTAAAAAEEDVRPRKKSRLNEPPPAGTTVAAAASSSHKKKPRDESLSTPSTAKLGSTPATPSAAAAASSSHSGDSPAPFALRSRGTAPVWTGSIPHELNLERHADRQARRKREQEEKQKSNK